MDEALRDISAEQRDETGMSSDLEAEAA